MTLEELKKEYDKLQPIYGDESLDSIYFGGKDNNPDICFVFMNPTSRNIASSKTWKGLKSPWIGTKNIWKLFYQLELLDEEIYDKIRKSDKNWTETFAKEVYDSVKSYNYFITNLGKCTQIDARVLKDNVYKNYLELFKKELEIVNPKVIILFGNQVSKIVLNKNISVSKSRKEKQILEINNKKYDCYAVFYPVGNGSFNIDKSIEDIKYIIKEELK